MVSIDECYADAVYAAMAYSGLDIGAVVRYGGAMPDSTCFR